MTSIGYQSPIQTEYLWDCELANQENSKKRVTKKLNEIIKSRGNKL